MSAAPSNRIEAIDAFRAMTMLLMLWVNDFWTLNEIPNWLQHQPAEADALGFSDIIFPLFLFVVGLSIPFALSKRIERGDTKASILKHIGERSFALLLMGIFMVNLEYMPGERTFEGRYFWQIAMIIAFVLIWNAYPKEVLSKTVERLLKGLGYGILLGLALVYKGPGDPTAWMQTYWWGILGLIGWSYLLCSIAYLFWGDRIWPMAAVWIFFVLLNIADHSGHLHFFSPIKDHIWIVSSGSLPAMTIAGVFVSTLYLRKYSKSEHSRSFLRDLIVLGIATLIIGLLLRPAWGISKIRATPAWTEICSAIGFLGYAALYWIIDIRGLRKWWHPIKPAGTATLTCYLIPYLYYALGTGFALSLPLAVNTGIVGLAKSMLYSFLIVWLAGRASKAHIRLRI